MTAPYITERDIEALARIAYAEASSIAESTGDFKAAYGSIAEAVLNRAMSRQDYLGRDDYLGGISISGVINKPKQFTPINKIKRWERLPPAPPEVKEAVRQHLADLQAGAPSYIGKRTHYLNPFAPRTASAKRTWAKDWQSWPSVGVAPHVHYFGSPDQLAIPDYTPQYEPEPIPTPRPDPNASIADQYSYLGLTRTLAPASPVDRQFHTLQSEHRRLGNDLSGQGLLGLDGRQAVPLATPPDPIDTRSIRSRSSSRRARAAANRRSRRADSVGPESLAADQYAPDAGRLFAGVPGTRGLLGAATAPRFAPTYADIAGLMAHPAYGARLQTDFPGGLTPKERIAIGNVPRAASNLDYRMAGIASNPDLETAALDSNPTYQAPQPLAGGGTLGQIGPRDFAGRQYGGGLAEMFAARDMVKDPRSFDARAKQEEEAARARKADAVMAGRDLAQGDRQAVGPAPMQSTPVPPTPAADAIAAMLAGMDRLAPRPASTFPARKAVIASNSPAGSPNAAAPMQPQPEPTIADPNMQTTLQEPATRARLGTAPAAHRPRQRTISPLDVFPPAPPAPSEPGALGTGLSAALRSALLGGLTGGLPGAAIGFFGGLLGDQFGPGVGGLLGNNGPTGPATPGEMFNAGYGTPGIGQGMYGPRGATGWSLSNPGSFATSRGPGQGYDLTSGKYGWREHYDENGNFRGISYADGSSGGLLGSLFGGGSGKSRKSDKGGAGKGSGKSMAPGLY